MRKVSPETPTRAQHSGMGTLSINPAGGALATTGGGAVRITPAGAGLEGTGPVKRTVAFIGVSGVGVMRAVSLRGAADALRFSIGVVAGGRPGFKGEDAAAGGIGRDAGGFAPGGGGSGEGTAAGGGGNGVLKPDGGGGSGAFTSEAVGSGSGVFNPMGGAGGRTALDGMGAGGRAIGGAGGRLRDVPSVGGIGLGATKGGGGRTDVGAGEVEVEFGTDIPGGRAGKLIRTVSFSTGTVGRWVVRGGRVIRTVSFFGSFRSAILL